MTFTRNTKRAIAKYDESLCRAAYERNRQGDGANTIAWTLGLPNTNAADAAINAGRELESEQAS